MSLSTVRPFIRTQMNSLNFKEHTEPFSDQNIPANVIDRAYHISAPEVNTPPANQIVNNIDYSFTLSVFIRGFRDVGNLLDICDSVADTVYNALLDPTVRLDATNSLKNLETSGYSLRPLSPSNDNIAVLDFSFNAKVFLCFGSQ